MSVLIRRMFWMGVMVWGASVLLRQRKSPPKRTRLRSEGMLDEALDHTFPASDPTATQDFAIPANRL